ncbi:DUF4964 domain-containing protein [Bacteroides thetaiotaomicron]|nr:DUF4964 domain-containing protein [Bacteroides thetaiotaomicron]
MLRAPSVPIIVSDPYFSIWSPYDKLMEGSTEHWTSAKKPLLGALRVDGKVYRFLGKDKINLVPIAPMTNVERWEAAYTNSQPSNGWQEFQFDDSNWKKGKQRLVVVIWNVFTQNGKETIPISTFVALSILMNRISLKIFI